MWSLTHCGGAATRIVKSTAGEVLELQSLARRPPDCRYRPCKREDPMQHLATLLTAAGGLIFSIAVAVLVEEFIFGQIFKTFFAQPGPSPAPPV